jgi:D-amino-acid dehydrogenase
MSKHVLIVGAGIAGLSTAWYLAQKGHRVTVLDRGTAQSAGCSFGNAGIFAPSHFVPLAAPGVLGLGLRFLLNPESPFYVKPRLDGDLLRWGLAFWRASNARAVERAAPVLRDLHLASRACFEEWLAAWGDDFGFTPRGLLMLCATEQGLAHEAATAAHARALGIPAEVLTPAETAAREPSVALAVVGSVFFPLDAHMVPERLMDVLTRQVQRAGVTLSWDCAVTGWRREGGRVTAVRTPHGERTADEYIVCAGVWSSCLARDLELRLPLQAGRGYSLTLPQPRRLIRSCAVLSEARVAVTPMGTALRVGGTLELAGLDARVNPRRVRGIIRSFVRYLPDFTADDFAGVTPWCGLRPCSPDGLPYLGRFEHYANLSTASGHAMMGVGLGPITGKLMAEIISGERPSLDVAPLRPDRYAGHA